MRLEERKHVLIGDIGNIRKIEYGITPENLWMAIKAFYNYSDAISSFIRELTSNCFDSHIEAKILPYLDDDILVNEKKYKREELPYLKEKFSKWEDKNIVIKLNIGNALLKTEPSISFQDFGVGLSLERIELIYSKFFSSTKRSGNDEIGAFGLGSKSPLGYTQVFNVTSVFEGVKRYVTIQEGNKGPILNILYEEETDEENGTIVSVPIQTKDLPKINSSIRSQLCYFNNITYKGFDEKEVSSDYIIYEGDNFLYKQNTPFENLHVSLGKVYYPISTVHLGVGYFISRVPLALKFQVGELDVVWNRESLEYTDKTTKAIEEKINEVIDELQKIHDEKYGYITSLAKYFKATKERSNINKDSLEIYPGVVISELKKVINLDIRYNKYKAINGVPKDIFFQWNIYANISEGVKKKSVYSNATRLLLTNNKTFVISDNISTHKNNYLNFCGLNNFHLIKRNKTIDRYIDEDLITTIDLINENDYEESLKTLISSGCIYIDYSYILDGELVDNHILINNEEKLKEFFDENTIKLKNSKVDKEINHFAYVFDIKYDVVVENIDLIKEYIREADELITRFIPSYEDVEISKEWSKSQRKLSINQKKKYLLEKEGSKTIPIRPLSLDNNEYQFYRDYTTVDRLINNTGLIIYGYNKDNNLLVGIAPILFTCYNYLDDNGNLSSKICKIIKISKSNKKYLMENPNAIHVKDLIKGKGKQNIIIRHITARLLAENIPDGFYQLNYPIMEKINPRVYKAIKTIDKYIYTYYFKNNKYRNDPYVYRHKRNISSRWEVSLDVDDSLFDLFLKNKLWDSYILEEFKIVKAFINRFPLLKAINFDICKEEELLVYINAIGNINPKLALKIEEKTKQKEEKDV